MEFWLARAMQVAALDDQQLGRIHVVERRRGHCIGNFNIQDILQIPTIKERFYIPDEAEQQAKHARRLEVELKEKNFIPQPSGMPETSNMAATHEMDLAIQERGHEVLWDFQSGRAQGGSLKRRLASRMEP